jgi:hypothetical protein
MFDDRLEQLPLRFQERRKSRILGCQLRGKSVATSACAGYFGVERALHGTNR